MVWVVERDDQSNYEYDVTTWSSEDDALKHATNDMINHINNIYDDSDLELIEAVKKINELLKTNSYSQAINYWNSCDYTSNSSESVFWEVNDILTKPYRGGVATLNKLKYPFLDEAPQTTPSAGGVINNHTCVQCGNTRCNTSEKSCWVCGTPIQSFSNSLRNAIKTSYSVIP